MRRKVTPSDLALWRPGRGRAAVASAQAFAGIYAYRPPTVVMLKPRKNLRFNNGFTIPETKRPATLHKGARYGGFCELYTAFIKIREEASFLE